MTVGWDQNVARHKMKAWGFCDGVPLTMRPSFSYVSQKTDFDLSCKLSPKETICIKVQNLFFLGKIGKQFKRLSAEILPCMLHIKAKQILTSDILSILFFHFFEVNKVWHFMYKQIKKKVSSLADVTGTVRDNFQPV